MCRTHRSDKQDKPARDRAHTPCRRAGPRPERGAGQGTSQSLPGDQGRVRGGSLVGDGHQASEEGGLCACGCACGWGAPLTPRPTDGQVH